MLKEERLDFILQRLKEDQVVKLTELSQRLNVSEDTIRRDIETLDKNGLCQKVRGGAIPHSPNIVINDFKDRVGKLSEQKTVIAQKALTLIRPNSTIFLDSGTTSYKLATMLPLGLPLTIITHSIPVAVALMDNPGVEVILAGGRVSKTHQVTIGVETARTLEHFRADVYFTGICSLHHEFGITNENFEESEIKRILVKQSARVVALTTCDKLGTAEVFKICDIQDVDTIVTENENSLPLFNTYKNLSINIL